MGPSESKKWKILSNIGHLFQQLDVTFQHWCDVSWWERGKVLTLRSKFVVFLLFFEDLSHVYLFYKPIFSFSLSFCTRNLTDIINAFLIIFSMATIIHRLYSMVSHVCSLFNGISRLLVIWKITYLKKFGLLRCVALE